MSKLTKIETIRLLAQRSETTQPVAKRVYEALGEIALEEIAKENSITLFKGLVVYGKRANARRWENPLIGGYEDIPERVVPRARFSDELKRMLKERS